MESLEHYPALLDHAQDILLVLGIDGTIRYTNAAAERILGHPPETLVGQDAFGFVHPDDRARTRRAFDRLVASDSAVDEIEHRTRAADGSWVWLQSRMEEATDADLDGYVVSARDVTDRKRAEADHETSQSRLREIAEQANEVLWMFSADWSELLFVNPAYERISGVPTDRLRENPVSFLEVIHPDDRDRVLEAMTRLSAGEEVTVEYRANPDREFRRWVQVEGVPIFENGDVARVAGYARDVTDRRRRERQLLVMDRLLRHNLSNDMNVILGYADLARERSDGEVAECLETILRTGKGLLETAAKERSIVNLLSDPAPCRPVELGELVETAVAGLRDDHPGATVDVSVPGGVEVSTRPELRLAVEELLENAVIHADTDAPTVQVAVERRDDIAELCVSDVGPPIPENEVEMLSDNISDVSHGTGLGLWLVFWVVDLSDGNIEFRADTSRGNCVAVTLPLVSD